ncbi:uncharacterized protein isoform X2 [Musca autumnalis]
MIREIGRHLSGSPKSKGEHYMFWCELRDKLNSLGPPTRNITEWKKVWNDCQRSRKRRELFRQSLRRPKEEQIEVRDEPIYDDCGEPIDMYQQDDHYNDGEAEEQQEDNMHMYHNDSTQNSQDLHNNYDDTVSSFIISEPNEPNYEGPVIQRSLPPLYRCPPLEPHLPRASIPPAPPPPLPQAIHAATPQTFNHFVVSTTPKPSDANHSTSTSTSSSSFNQDILNVLKSQMLHQTKLLEHMSRVSNNMSQLMERQVAAIEKQTEAVRRQAIAMEHHTLVMNSFVDMIRDKMPKTNSNNRQSSQNGKL